MVSDYMSLICKNLGVKPSYNSFGGYFLMFSSPISPKSLIFQRKKNKKNSKKVLK